MIQTTNDPNLNNYNYYFYQYLNDKNEVIFSEICITNPSEQLNYHTKQLEFYKYCIENDVKLREFSHSDDENAIQNYKKQRDLIDKPRF